MMSAAYAHPHLHAREPCHSQPVPLIPPPPAPSACFVLFSCSRCRQGMAVSSTRIIAAFSNGSVPGVVCSGCRLVHSLAQLLSCLC